ncbi:MAG: protein TolR [Deltaproteobacteria bacterium]|nr:protein TolR [Deltaproteobacteria bacterium]
MMTGGGDNKRFMSDINVTPFVDVMLVLLIIFMVTAPMMIQGVDVNLPQTTTKELKTAQQEEPLILTVNKDTQISIEKTVIKLEELGPKLNAILQYREDKQVLLRADKDVPYGFVVKVMAAVKGAGIERLGMITEPED